MESVTHVSGTNRHLCLGSCTLLGKTNTASPVWADTAYRSAANEAHLVRHGPRSRIYFRRKPGRDLTQPQRKTNRTRTAVRSAVETVFTAQKHGVRLVIRTIGIARATTKIGLANLAYNIRRFIWIEGGHAVCEGARPP